MFRNLYPEARYSQGHAHLAAVLNNIATVLRRQRKFEAAAK